MKASSALLVSIAALICNLFVYKTTMDRQEATLRYLESTMKPKFKVGEVAEMSFEFESENCSNIVTITRFDNFSKTYTATVNPLNGKTCTMEIVGDNYDFRKIN